MLFKSLIRQFFSEDLTVPSNVDKIWRVPSKQAYKQKILLNLHQVSPRSPVDMITEKLKDLKNNQMGISSLVLSGSSKLPTNLYIREIAKNDWGVEEIRLHGTESVNIYAFINLISSAFFLRRVIIFNNGWSNQSLDKIRAVMSKESSLELK
ncbi:MAG: hypothetical protein H6492_00860 [Candidatus Paracaedibacteraceae bacterium]|nr:hypothetical protein [Candidatus Paracaedibacteraceae bacterium]